MSALRNILRFSCGRAVKRSDQTNLVRHYRQRQSSMWPCLDYVTTQSSTYNRLQDADEIALPLTLITASDHGCRGGEGQHCPPARSPPLPHLSPGFSVHSTDRHSLGWDGFLVHYWDCTAPEKRVRLKSHYALLISWFRSLRSIVAKVFDFRLWFDYHLITKYIALSTTRKPCYRGENRAMRL